jgi:hypothetical protein
LVDIANLIGSGHFTQEQAERWKRILFSEIGYGNSDIAQVATGSGTKSEVAFAFQPIRVEAAHGQNGADFALSDHISNIAAVAASYSEVVIASGDHHFAESAKRLIAAGVKVTVVTGIGRLHGDFLDLALTHIDLKEGWEIVS